MLTESCRMQLSTSSFGQHFAISSAATLKLRWLILIPRYCLYHGRCVTPHTVVHMFVTVVSAPRLLSGSLECIHMHSQSLAARCSACSAAQLYQPASCAAGIHDCLIFTVFIAICEPDYAYHAVAQCCAQRHSSCVVHSLQSSFAHQVSNHSNDVLDNMYS